MSTSSPLDHVSCTKFDMGMRCWYAFFRRYILGEKTPPGAALIFGRADDQTKNAVYEKKIETHETMTIPACQEVFSSEFDDVIKNEDEIDWHDDNRGELKDRGVALIGHWRTEIAIKTKPVAVQGKFSVPIEYTHQGDLHAFEFMGYWDFVEEMMSDNGEVRKKRVVTDNKTSGKRWGKSKVAESSQGVGYALAAELDPELKELGVDPSEVHFHIVVKSKTPVVQHPDTDPHLVRVTDAEERSGFSKILSKFHLAVASNIKTGNWLPNRANYLCSKKWCGYWRVCQKEHGGVIKD